MSATRTGTGARISSGARAVRSRRRGVVGRALGVLAILAGGLSGLLGAGPESTAPAEAPAMEAAAVPLADWEKAVARFEIRARGWLATTPPLARVGWAGLGACGVLGAMTLAGRMIRTRPSRVIPRPFVTRFQRRLEAGELDAGKALDYCELNPSAASRVALAAVRRWGRPVIDQERAVSLAVRVEADGLRRNLGTLRRVAALAPLVGLLGTLGDLQDGLATVGPASDWGPALAGALGPLTAGVALAILALVAFDGLTARVEGLIERLDRIGAEAIDGMTPAPPVAAGRSREVPPHPHHLTTDAHVQVHEPVRAPQRGSTASRRPLTRDESARITRADTSSFRDRGRERRD